MRAPASVALRRPGVAGYSVGMRAFLRRRRWWLLGAVQGPLVLCLAVWLPSLGPDAMEAAFHRVQLGMTLSEVDAVMEGTSRRDRERYENPVVRDPPADYRFVVNYWFSHRKVSVVFDLEGTAVDKYQVKFSGPSFLDRLQWWLKRFRAALGL
jgi:hypothetical protein